MTGGQAAQGRRFGEGYLIGLQLQLCVAVVVGLSELADKGGWMGSEYEWELRQKYICVSASSEILGIPDRERPGESTRRRGPASILMDLSNIEPRTPR